MSLQEQDYLARSASTFLAPPPKARLAQEEVAKLIDVSVCIGCKSCQVACSAWNDTVEEVGYNHGVLDNPKDLSARTWTMMRYQEVELDGRLEWLIRKDGCMHCANPGCLAACPVPGAIVQHANGIVDFIADKCIGCGYCLTGCPFNIPRISLRDRHAYKCTLCIDRVSVGQEPACAKACPTGAIRFGSKADMRDYAASRVDELKERGFAQAGLYDPSGVGGTHVMYTLHHADKPQLYSGLPENPKINPLTIVWKEVSRPVFATVFAAVFLISLVHRLSVGAVEPDESAMVGFDSDLPRHSLVERAAHWLTALCFILLATSGLGFFFSPLSNLTGILGAPQIAQFMHPVFGVTMMCSLLLLSLINIRHVFWEKSDFTWLAHLGDVIRGHEHDVCDVGQYNAGQKALFWANGFLLVILLITGLVVWRPYFAHNFSVETLRLAVFIHSIAACLLMLAIFVHVYMVFWYKGTLRAMVRGTVTRAWAELHHPAWLRRVDAAAEQRKKEAV